VNRKISLSLKVDADQKGQRIDVVVAKAFPEFSRSHLQKFIKEGTLKVNGKQTKAKKILEGNELIEIKATETSQKDHKPENISLDILFQDEHIIVINKEPGLVVHPGAGNRSGTLVNGLINYDSKLAYLPRAGIVHRLDKNTSGLMVVSRNERSYLHLIEQLKRRTVVREYSALVVGEPITGGIINKPIGRHPKFRTKQAVIKKGREAITKYKTIEKMKGYSLLEVSLKTGRTHQIRVHLSYLGFPIIGDSVYGGRKKYAKGTSDELRSVIDNFKRQALHASSLALKHPSTNEIMNFNSDLPEDMTSLRKALKTNE